MNRTARLDRIDTRGRVPAINGDEQDATSPAARRALAYLGHAGVTSSIKRGMRRRVRADGRTLARNWQHAY